MNYYIPTKIYQENDCVKNHASELSLVGSRALIITGKTSSKKNGSLDDVTGALNAYNIPYLIFDEVEENPSIDTCVAAAKMGLDYNADFCIGVGGGSPLDAAKAIALLIGNKSLDSEMFYSPELATSPAIPVVCVPTTAGTGSEATPYAILTLPKKETKQSISHRIFPVLALCDPGYLKSLPYSVLKNTAIDTLAHLIESYLNCSATTYTRMLSEYGLKLWGEIREDLSDMSMTDEAYASLMNASTIGGMAISHTGTSIPHGLSYHLTYKNKVPHGAACGLFLPGYLYFCIKNEAIKNISIGLEDASILSDTETVFSLLKVKGLEEFARMLYTLLGDIPVAEELWQKDLDMIMNNPAKTAKSPYPVTRQELEMFI